MSRKIVSAYVAALVKVAEQAEGDSNPWDESHWEAIAPAVAARVLRDFIASQTRDGHVFFPGEEAAAWARDRGIDLGDMA